MKGLKCQHENPVNVKPMYFLFVRNSFYLDKFSMYCLEIEMAEVEAWKQWQLDETIDGLMIL